MAPMLRVKSVRALDRGLQIAELIAGKGAASLHELHEATGLPKATLLRSLKTLAERQWVRQRPNSTTYVAGPLMLAQARTPRQRTTLAALAVPVLDALSRQVVWPSDLAVRRGDAMSIIEHSRRSAPFVINRDAVGRSPRFLQSALGRAYLAFCPEAECREIMDRLRRSSHPDDRRVHATKWVRGMLLQTRARGYGLREPGYWAGVDDVSVEMNSIAVPVMKGGRVIACLNLIWVPDAIGADAFAAKYLPALKQAAGNLAERFAIPS